MQPINDRYGLIATQHALLGAVTPNLRVVTIKVCLEEKMIKICFFYDGEISEEDFEIANTAITEVISDFPLDYQLDDHIERIDYPNAVPIDGRVVFRRKERS
ncbi:MAG: hypothetical protein S4CHLAM123_03320 [Chlamydiales bacterium]|nr:hypothetical protein [Chlamydiales bacterium]